MKARRFTQVVRHDAREILQTILMKQLVFYSRFLTFDKLRFFVDASSDCTCQYLLGGRLINHSASLIALCVH